MTGRYGKVQADGSIIIGRLCVGPGVLGYGSAGTIVYEGRLDGRVVAVKRLLRQFYDLAKKEIEVLIMSDEHPNVVRCFAMEEDREFVYLALERCRSTLNDFLGTPQGCAALVEGPQRTPTPLCLEMMCQVARGLAALHERGIVHRDLKPHNVLITDGGRVKLSDMGLSKQLVAEQSSFESHGAGGSSGWQAPEQLIARDGIVVRQTRSMDIFSLGCVLYYCITGGRHPFGDSYERDTNILRHQPNYAPLAHQPEALNLLHAMLLKEPSARPTMLAVLAHPLWWSAEQQLQFLADISDRVENEDREPDQSLLAALEAYASVAIGPNWGCLVHPELVANLGRHRRYDFTKLRDLLRVVRNKRSHFREMPASLQGLLGPLPQGFLRYFTGKFPSLLIGTYIFALQQLGGDPVLSPYWPCGVSACDPFQASFFSMHKTKAPAVHQGAAELGKASAGEDRQMPPGSPPQASRSGSATAEQGANGSNGPALDSGSGSSSGAAEMDGREDAAATAAAAAAAPLVVVGYEVADMAGPVTTLEFPQRPDKQLCDFYIKTGHCKFGETCVFHHPPEHAVQLTSLGLPLRPGQPVCVFYLKHNSCKYGAACRWHHPLLQPIYAGSLATPQAANQELYG